MYPLGQQAARKDPRMNLRELLAEKERQQELYYKNLELPQPIPMGFYIRYRGPRFGETGFFIRPLAGYLI